MRVGFVGRSDAAAVAPDISQEPIKKVRREIKLFFSFW